MQFVKPIPFQEAIDKVGSKSPVGSQMNSAEWRDVPVALRERAFFSSTVESVRVLQRGRVAIGDFLSNARETLPNGEQALKTGSRADFIKQMQEFLQGEGIERAKGGLTDITSERRLGLIFDVQTRQAHDFGYWKQGQDSAVLDEFPAQRFIRVQDVKEARTEHERFEGEVRLKSDLNFWIALNKDFGVPWGPWGWGCGHDVEDVDRDEAEDLGLIRPGETVPPFEGDFNARLEAGTRGLDPDLVAKLKAELGDQIEEVDGALRWTGRSLDPQRTVTPASLVPPLPTPRPTPKDQLPDLSDLATRYQQARPAQIPALREEARIRLSIPEPDRAPMPLVMGTRVPEIRRDAQAGAEIVTRYTSAALVRTTKISVSGKSGDRACYSPGTKTVHLSRHSGQSTAAHEIMHGIEHQNAHVRRAAAEFLLKRGEGERPQTLRALTGNPGYRSHERAFRDKWLERNGSPYAGKIYASGEPQSPESIQFTEVLTMGVERLHADPLEFYKNDRDWFNFVVKTLRNI